MNSEDSSAYEEAAHVIISVLPFSTLWFLVIHKLFFNLDSWGIRHWKLLQFYTKQSFLFLCNLNSCESCWHCDKGAVEGEVGVATI